jgi:ribosome-binding protein aMBF1 (putative translation factor)
LKQLPLMTTISEKSVSIKTSFHDALRPKNFDEKIEHDASVLAFRFLSEIEIQMDKLGISKKDLAAKIGTSPSYITQIFRGDKLTNFVFLAKVQDALNIQFEIQTATTLRQNGKATKRI